jgi:hypothetical protein
MSRRSLLITALAIAGAALFASAPASAQPIDKGHFHDVGPGEVFDCDGTPAQQTVDVSGNFVFNLRGSITITGFSSGGSRSYDTNGNLVIRDPGQLRVAFDIDYNGTPSDPDDDIFVDGSFRIVRASTGNSDTTDRDFCADLVAFTQPS